MVLGSTRVAQGRATPADVSATLHVGAWPSSLAVDPVNGYVYVTNQGSSNLSVISGSEEYVVASVGLPNYAPLGLTVDNRSGDVFVLGGCVGDGFCDSSRLGVVSGNTNRFVTNISTKKTIGWSGVFDPANGALYISPGAGSVNDSHITVVNPSNYTVEAEIPLSNLSYDLVYNPTNADLYLLSYSNLTIVSTAWDSVVGSLTLPGGREGPLVVDTTNGDVYCASNVSDTDIVTVVSGTTGTVLGTIAAGPGEAYSMAFDPVTGDLYLATYRSGTVSILSGATNTLVSTVPVGVAPVAMAVDSVNGDVYVANSASNNVSVISGATNTVMATIPVESSPTALVFDPGNGNVYVANERSGTVSVIPTVFPSIPNGWSWSAVVVLGLATTLAAGLIIMAWRAKRPLF